VAKNCRAGQATFDNLAHAHCILDTYGYKYTYTGCAILTAFPLQQWLYEHTSTLHFTYIAYRARIRGEGFNQNIRNERAVKRKIHVDLDKHTDSGC